MGLEGDGLSIELPAGWQGRWLAPSPHLTALQASNATLVADDGELGERSTATMAPGSVFLSLIEYLPGSGVEAGRGAFSQAGLELPLDPTQFSPERVAHPRPAQSATQQAFSLSGRALSLYVVVVGGLLTRRRQLLVLDQVLGTLKASER